MNRNLLNNGFGPVHKERRKLPIKLACCGLLVAIVLARHEKKDLQFYSALVSASLLGQLVRRTFLFAEEMFHVESRYQGSKVKALKMCIGLSDFKYVIFAFIIATANIIFSKPMEFTYYIACAAFTALVPYIFDLGMRCKLEIGHDNRIKYVADGQAWGYYVGYLKIILTKWEVTISKARGENFQDPKTKKDYRKLIMENDQRLFILIPRDGSCFLTMDELDSNIELATSMPELKQLRGGVMERKYSSTLYRIKRDDGDDVYAMMEYATPLLNMYEMSKEAVRIDGFEFTEADREEQVNEFYNTLKRLLEEDKNCKGKYELVLMGPSETYRGKHNFGNMICDRIRGTTQIELN